MQKQFNRRDFLRTAGLTMLAGGSTLLLGGCNQANQTVQAQNPTATYLPVTQSNNSRFVPDVELALQAVPTEMSILSGSLTQVWQFQAQGDSTVIQTLPNSYLGPIMRFRQGQKVRIHFTNQLPEESIVHWHGLYVPEVADGHPRNVIPSGGEYIYEFEVKNRAGSYWYHPHPHGRTGPQVYYGLAGLIFISDDEETGLPAGEYDIPLVIQDRTFDDDNQLVYGIGMMHQMQQHMLGFLGDQILVNGEPDYSLSVATRVYRLRLYNGSNARIYKLAWNDGTPMTVIGVDGGLLEVPVQRDYITLAPAQRIELWADFSQKSVGTELTLQSLPFDFIGDMAMMNDSMMNGGQGGGGMMHGGQGGGMMHGGQGGGMMDGQSMMSDMMQQTSLLQGSRFDVMKILVERADTERLTLPDKLSTINWKSPADTVKTRQFTFAMAQMMSWTINGRTWEMDVAAPDETVKSNSSEIWELYNNSPVPHPVHLHGNQFQILERQVDSNTNAIWQTVSGGFVDDGLNDTVLVMPGERVKILVSFLDYTGLFVYHCHLLEHEDMGMMRNYKVT
jgi:FtsP/CotA-like multicopper oxidase with cupredoxin domain